MATTMLKNTVPAPPLQEVLTEGDEAIWPTFFIQNNKGWPIINSMSDSSLSALRIWTHLILKRTLLS